jgi:hypothetical protein
MQGEIAEAHILLDALLFLDHITPMVLPYFDIIEFRVTRLFGFRITA